MTAEAKAVRKKEEILLQWQGLQEPVSIYQDMHPDFMHSKLIWKEAVGGQCLVPAALGERPCFLLVAANGCSISVAERLLPMEGVVNFRDLGGYLTSDGKHRTRWGLLYRSGAHDALSARDEALLRKIGLKTVVDYRSTQETKQRPDKKVEGIAYLHFRPLPEGNATEILNVKMTSVDEAVAALAGINRVFIKEASAHEAYENLLRTILKAENLPLVQHCTAGKDRVGAGVAILLSILGVPRETIIADYLLSNEHQVPAEKLEMGTLGKGAVDGERIKLFQALAMVHPEYIGAFFDELDSIYGGIEAYCHEALHLTPAELHQLRAVLLEEV